MSKDNYKKICVGACLLVFLCYGFFGILVDKTSALEVQYPTIGSGSGGQPLGATTELPAYVTYMFNFGMSLGILGVFISFVIAGVMYFLSPVSPGMLSGARDRRNGAISGLLILVLTYLIITTINPQLNVFSTSKLPKEPTIPIPMDNTGVYLYENTGCPNPSDQFSTTSIANLGPLSNGVKSVGIVQNPGIQSYISILYASINYRGKCQYLNPKVACQPVTLKPGSASIYEYDLHPGGSGVYFYRKSYFDMTGGYYFISNAAIKDANGNAFDLNQLKFTGSTASGNCTVSEKEQNCVQYDKNGKCCQKADTALKCTKDGRSCPTLSGENISSVKIVGTYLVLFFYYGPRDSQYGPWTSCQEFPTVDDINKNGPQQIKWEDIRNTGSTIPNYVIITPVQSY